MLEGHLGAEKVLNVHRYSDMLSKLVEFSNRFCDFEKVDPFVTFIVNPFLDVDICELSGLMAVLFSVDYVKM